MATHQGGCTHAASYSTLQASHDMVHVVWCGTVALRDDMRAHVPDLLPLYIAVLADAERSGVYDLVPPTLETMVSLEVALEEQLYLFLPALVRLIDPGVSLPLSLVMVC